MREEVAHELQRASNLTVRRLLEICPHGVDIRKALINGKEVGEDGEVCSAIFINRDDELVVRLMNGFDEVGSWICPEMDACQVSYSSLRGTLTPPVLTLATDLDTSESSILTMHLHIDFLF